MLLPLKLNGKGISIGARTESGEACCALFAAVAGDPGQAIDEGFHRRASWAMLEFKLWDVPQLDNPVQTAIPRHGRPCGDKILPGKRVRSNPVGTVIASNC
jgi:hypothetical protein